MIRHTLLNNRGFTLFDVLVALGLVGTMAAIASAHQSKKLVQAKTSTAQATRERISLAFQNIARMPAAVRNSARAADGTGTTPVNPDLTNCVFGLKPNSCKTDITKGFDLYAPTVALDSTGKAVGIVRIATAMGSAEKVRVDSYGAMCNSDSPDCIFKVNTSFQPRCGPAPMPAVMPADLMTPNVFVPTPTCTVAETIQVIYTVALDENAAVLNPAFGGTFAPITGSALVSVKAVSGNDPQ